MKYLIDSSAWVSYLMGGLKGEEVNKILLKENQIFVIAPIISEVISFIKRNKENVDTAYRVLINNSLLIDISENVARKAGIMNAEFKSNDQNMPLVDCLIACVSQELDLIIVTKDSHFKSFKNVLLLK